MSIRLANFLPCEMEMHTYAAISGCRHMLMTGCPTVWPLIAFLVVVHVDKPRVMSCSKALLSELYQLIMMMVAWFDCRGRYVCCLPGQTWLMWLRDNVFDGRLSELWLRLRWGTYAAAPVHPLQPCLQCCSIELIENCRYVLFAAIPCCTYLSLLPVQKQRFCKLPGVLFCLLSMCDNV